MANRSAGVLLHPTSLPGRFGIGDLGPSVEQFLDWAVKAGQTVWQVLPLGPTGYGNSPYGTLSAFAGNPLLISPERLLERGFITKSDLADATQFPTDYVDFGGVIAWKERLLRSSFAHFQRGGTPADHEAFARFVRDPDQGWLDEWSLFQSFKVRFGQKRWRDWVGPAAAREPSAIEAAKKEMSEEIAYHSYVQFLFFQQWEDVRRAANSRGIRILGDVPIYVAFDSADVWGNRELFLLDESLDAIAVAGVPPDYFSETGQLWGNPLYRWERMAEDGYAWWIARMRSNLRMADLVRLDHFRGFAGYWQVPAGEPTAVAGSWFKGPGIDLFRSMHAALGELPIVAEDLGLITPDVEELRVAIGAPGMRVLQFGFGDLDNIHLPHHHEPNMVAYTGTHDNATAREWFLALEPDARKLVHDYLGMEQDEEIEWQMIRTAYGSVARIAIVPMQDVLGAGARGRMNTPGRAADNWSWRLTAEQLDGDDAAGLRRLAEITGRADPEA